MAEHDDLMRDLPKDVERVTPEGPFFIRRYPGSYSVVVLTAELVTHGGGEAKERASRLASSLNEAWKQYFEVSKDNESTEQS